jgi:hypothetical protein
MKATAKVANEARVALTGSSAGKNCEFSTRAVAVPKM